MYNARLFYNMTTGDIIRVQTINGGTPISIEDDLAFVSELSGVPVENIGYLEWNEPENELETLMSEGKVIEVDITQTPHVLYGEEPIDAQSDEYATVEDYEAALEELGV